MQLVVGRIDISAVATFVIVFARKMVIKIVGVTHIFIAILANVVKGRVVQVTVEGIARYEQPAAAVAPLVAMYCCRRRVLNGAVSTAKIPMAWQTEVGALPFIDDELIFTRHSCCG